jgi:hypothetical protein
MNNRFYVRPTSEDQIAFFVNEWQRNVLLEQKAICEAKKMTIREVMEDENDWEDFVKACIEDGDDPEVACARLQQLIDEVV